ncbi:MAG: calcium-binding protein [Hyphomicrobiaceae bacterium]
MQQDSGQLKAGSAVAIIKGTKKKDILTGTAGADTISGLDGDDRLLGGQGSDKLLGGNGKDTLRGDDGNDVLDGGNHGDKLYGEDGKDLLKGGAGNDTLDGGEHNDKLYGGSGNDTLKGGYDDDYVNGGDGNDLIIAGYGRDTFVGGKGVDTVAYTGVLGAVNVSLTSGKGDNAAFGDTFSGIENVTGTAFSDVIVGDANANTLVGGAGFDTLWGNPGDDILIGGAGGDTLMGGAGADQLVGGDDNDTADYSFAVSGVIVDLLDPSLNTGEALGDTYQSIERIDGSDHDDELYGDDGNNTIDGADGDDVIYGRGGNDVLTNGQGNDFIDGGAGDDLIIYIIDSGSDTIHGGADNDWLYVLFSAGGVTINLTSGTGGGAAAGDTFATIENVHGSQFNDTLTAALNGWVNGGDGNDTIVDSGGTEYLYGGEGNDILTDNVLGSEDGLKDVFWLGYDQGTDTILGFDDGQDLLRISQSEFGITSLAANQVINSLTSAATIASAQFIYETDTKTLWFDQDGTGVVGPVAVAVMSSYVGTLDNLNFEVTTQTMNMFVG